MLDTVVKWLRTMSIAEVRQLAEDVGVPYATIIKVRYGSTRNPSYNTIMALWGRMHYDLIEKAVK